MTRQRPGVRIGNWLPAPARQRLARSAAGWLLVACAEATAYTVLALSIVHGRGPQDTLIAAAAALIITVLCSRGGYLSGARLAGDLYRDLGRALSRTKLAWFTASHRALVGQAAGAGVPSLMGLPAHQLQSFVLAPAIPLFLLVGIAIVSGLPTAGFVTVLLVIALGVQFLAQRRLAKTDAERHVAERAATSASLELVEHLELLRSSTTPSRVLARTARLWEEQERAASRTVHSAAWASLVSGCASVFPLGATVAFLVGTGGFADPAAALALILLVGRASAPIDELALVGIAAGELRAMSEAYREVVSAPVLSPRSQDNAEVPRDSTISIDSVSHPPVLSGLSALVPEGSRVHVAGASGAGKSTLVTLLARFDDPSEGTITLGGVDLRELDEGEIGAHIAYVPQEAPVFTGTLAANICLGRADASDEEIVDAAMSARLEGLLAHSPEGIHQDVGRNGSALSGGERQRVALARAFLKRSPVMILDEATSALDLETEERIVDAVKRYPGTVIFITHRSPEPWEPHLTIELDKGKES